MLCILGWAMPRNPVEIRTSDGALILSDVLTNDAKQR